MCGHSGKISLAIALVTAVLMGGCATHEELQVVQSSANHAVMTADQATATANQAKAAPRLGAFEVFVTETKQTRE